MDKLPETMNAVVLEKFGGPENLIYRTIPVPELGAGEVLISVEWAGVGEWDPFEREGGYAEMLGQKPEFPYVLGSEGSGVIAALGDGVEDFHVGDPVYTSAFLNPKGGLYAEYAVVDVNLVSHIPSGLTIQQAGVMSGVGLTALRGLEDTLHIQPGESVLIFGANGGIGHLAVQLAQRMGARVLGVASGRDGVALTRQLGVEAVVDGHKEDVMETARVFSPEGLDAALFTAGGPAAEQALGAIRSGGRVAYPIGVQIQVADNLDIQDYGYNGEPDADILKRLNHWIERSPFHVHIAHAFPLAQAAHAHRMLEQHYLGKIALEVKGST